MKSFKIIMRKYFYFCSSANQLANYYFNWLDSRIDSPFDWPHNKRIWFWKCVHLLLMAIVCDMLSGTIASCMRWASISSARGFGRNKNKSKSILCAIPFYWRTGKHNCVKGFKGQPAHGLQVMHCSRPCF